jgi:hypothetical protein
MDLFFGSILPTLRDIAVVVLAVEAIVIGLIVLFVLWQAWKLIGAVRRNLDRLVGLASDVLVTSADTARDVRGTTNFVTEHAAKPVIEVLSVLNAARQFARAAFSSQSNGKDHEN